MAEVVERVSGSCPGCGVPGRVVRVRREAKEIRGVPVTVTEIVRRCGACREERENTRDPDWRPVAYVAYARSRGWPTSPTLAAWRARAGLSSAEVDGMAGAEPGTTDRLERGGLPIEEVGERLRTLVAG